MVRITDEQLQHYNDEGYLIVRKLFSDEQVEEIKDTFMELHAAGTIPGFFEPASPEEAGNDPLKLYPRMLYPHRHHHVPFRYMLHPEVMGIMRELMGEEPLAAQSMFYFKPPGAKGQALHQDNFYLRAVPGTCIAAWTAIDAADQENGGLMVVPKTHELEIRCPHTADPEQSFIKDEVALPEGSCTVPADLKAGDVLFFNGSVIHGSYPNRSRDRFRRSFICHYVGASTTKIAREDLYNVNGEQVWREVNGDILPCGPEFDDGNPSSM